MRALLAESAWQQSVRDPLCLSHNSLVLKPMGYATRVRSPGTRRKHVLQRDVPPHPGNRLAAEGSSAGTVAPSTASII